ncbi:MAG: PDZ domain-containing protein, partial [Planctomycetota bacterium]|nr:PDZ domain-containing protein [Planctomycetota bacterium]
LGGRAHAEMMAMFGRQADEQARTLFPRDEMEWCFILVPRPEDVRVVFQREIDVDDPERTPGVYLHGRRLLVSRDIGSTMRHEFTHRMHWADMERLGQRHAMWVQEGLAGLYEDYVWRPDGSIRFVPNLRHNIARRQVAGGVDLDFEDLFRLDPESFLAGNARYYPQVRSLFEFLADLDLLATWYQTYCTTFDQDPTGGRAWERTFGLPLDDVNRRWRRWVRDRGGVDDRVDPGDPSLGVTGEEAGDGVRITKITGRQARRGGLRIGDVIMKLDGRPIRTRSELLVVLGECRTGQVVRLEVRRGSLVRMAEVRLEPRGR